MTLLDRRPLRRLVGAVGVALSVILSMSQAGLPIEPNPPDLTGTWATILFYPEIAAIPFVGEITITALVGVLTHAVQTGSSVILYDTYCRTEVLSDSKIVSSEVPDRVMASLAPPPRTAEIHRSSREWSFVQDWHLEVRGAVLDHPEHDPLPISPHDSRVIDMDDDGHPGFTVPVSALGIVSGDTYVVQRLRYRLFGDLLGPDRIEGLIEWTSEQNVIDGTDAFLMTPFVQWHDPDPSHHRFVMQRLPDGATCEDVEVVFETFLPSEDVQTSPGG